MEPYRDLPIIARQGRSVEAPMCMWAGGLTGPEYRVSTVILHLAHHTNKVPGQADSQNVMAAVRIR
jgi:hypothetical protein